MACEWDELKNVWGKEVHHKISDQAEEFCPGAELKRKYLYAGNFDQSHNIWEITFHEPEYFKSFEYAS